MSTILRASRLAPLSSLPITASTIATSTLILKRYATTSSVPGGPSPGTTPPPRRAVTIANDTGRVPWGELSIKEKAARTTQQSMNFGLIVLGAVMTIGVSYILYMEVFSTESKTAVFNRCLDRLRQDERCVELLAGKGHGGEIEGHGEMSWSRWARYRHVTSRQETDKVGVKHMHMHFYVSGPKNERGIVFVHMVMGREDRQWQYYSLALDVEGHERIWIENAEKGKWDKRSQGKMFGVKWW